MDKADQVLITAAVEGDIPPELDAHVVKVAWSVDNGSEVQE